MCVSFERLQKIDRADGTHFRFSHFGSPLSGGKQCVSSLGLLCRRFAPSCEHRKRKSLCRKEIKYNTFCGNRKRWWLDDDLESPGSEKKIPLKKIRPTIFKTICKHLYIYMESKQPHWYKYMNLAIIILVKLDVWCSIFVPPGPAVRLHEFLVLVTEAINTIGKLLAQESQL